MDERQNESREVKAYRLAAVACILALLLAAACDPAVDPAPEDDGDGSQSEAILVTAIAITAPSDSFAIATGGGTLQLTATATPSTASNTAVTWSVSAGSEYATVSSTGLVTAVWNGTATVRATAADGSGVSATKDIVVSGQGGIVNLGITPDGDTHTVYYQFATDMTFADAVIVEEGERTGATDSVALPVGTYYLRVFQDMDDDQAVSAGDLLHYHMNYVNANSNSYSFIPETVVIGHGDEESININLTSTDTTATVPSDMAFVDCTVAYTGSLATVTSSRIIGVGLDTSPTFDSGTGVGIYLYTAQSEAYLIVSAGTWYLGSFFDVNGNHETVPMPESGEPAEVYDNAAFGATDSYTTISLTAGQTYTANITLDDSLVIP